MNQNKDIASYSIKNQNKIITVPEGITILKEGEVNLDMYKIIKGNVEMYTGYGTENEVLLGILGPGACFGEFGILLRKPAIYTIVTYSDVQLFRVAESELFNFVESNSESIVQIMKNMAGMMMTMQQNITQLSQEIDDVYKKLLEKKDEAPSSFSKILDVLQKEAQMKQDFLRAYAMSGQDYISVNDR